ncbi:MAG TPA: aspartyl protease family protein [Holophagaceae bacterium]
MFPIAKSLGLATIICLRLNAQAGVADQLAALEKVMDHYYRGESVEDAVARSNRAVRAFNDRALALQAQAEQGQKQLKERIQAVEKKREQLTEMAKALTQVGREMSREEVEQRLRKRNELAQQIEIEASEVDKAAEVFNANAIRIKARIDSDRKRALELQAHVNHRLADYEAFRSSGQDLAFFHQLNGLLAEVRGDLRSDPTNGRRLSQLSTIRKLRRELASWATQAETRRPNGLLIVEAKLEDEPCWLVFDTGAMDTVISPELLIATGQNPNAFGAKSLSVIGGLRVPGIACNIPELTVAGQALSNVAASAVAPSDVGVDGLLGQTFLKAFTYHVDDRMPGIVVLNRK